MVAVAVATPAAAASTDDVGAFVLAGSCGNAGISRPGFTVRSGSGGLPVDTTILITGRGVSSIGVFTATPGIATITPLSSTARLATLVSPLPAGSLLGLRTTLSTTTAFTLDARATLPEGYVGTGATSAASVSSNEFVCAPG